MAIEIERKFLMYKNWLDLIDDNAFDPIEVQLIDQGYINNDPERVVRIRTVVYKFPNEMMAHREAAFITIKGKKNGASAPEFEYPIPIEEARVLLRLCLPGSIITKKRTVGSARGSTLLWEVDEFKGDLKGLIVAEIELPSEDAEVPAGMLAGSEAEVTTRPEYSNMSLAMNGTERVRFSRMKEQ